MDTNRHTNSHYVSLFKSNRCSNLFCRHHISNRNAEHTIWANCPELRFMHTSFVEVGEEVAIPPFSSKTEHVWNISAHWIVLVALPKPIEFGGSSLLCLRAAETIQLEDCSEASLERRGSISMHCKRLFARLLLCHVYLIAVGKMPQIECDSNPVVEGFLSSQFGIEHWAPIQPVLLSELEWWESRVDLWMLCLGWKRQTKLRYLPACSLETYLSSAQCPNSGINCACWDTRVQTSFDHPSLKIKQSASKKSIQCQWSHVCVAVRA